MADLDEIERKIRSIQNELDYLRKTRSSQFTSLNFEECVPPKSVCQDALSMMEGVDHYSGLFKFLGDYYAISKMGVYRDPKKVPKGAIACYHQSEGNAYTKTSINIEAALHEFFHHLVANRVVILHDDEKEEEMAEKYAELFVKRANSTVSV